MSTYYAIKISEGSYLTTSYESESGVTYTGRTYENLIDINEALYPIKSWADEVLLELTDPDKLYWNQDLEISFEGDESLENLKVVELDVEVKVREINSQEGEKE